MENLTITVTTEQLRAVMIGIMNDYESSRHPKIVYGIKGLAGLLNISIPKAQAIKNSGVLDVATYQIGRKLAFDAEKVLATLKVIPDEV